MLKKKKEEGREREFCTVCVGGGGWGAQGTLTLSGMKQVEERKPDKRGAQLAACGSKRQGFQNGLGKRCRNIIFFTTQAHASVALPCLFLFLCVGSMACQMGRFPKSSAFISRIRLVKSPQKTFGKGEARVEGDWASLLFKRTKLATVNYIKKTKL